MSSNINSLKFSTSGPVTVVINTKLVVFSNKYHKFYNGFC